jgi:hypothetical protein
VGEGELSKARSCEKSVSAGDLFIYATAAVQPIASVYEVNAPKTALEKRWLKPGKRGREEEWGTRRPVEAWREVKARFRKFRIIHTLV